MNINELKLNLLKIIEETYNKPPAITLKEHVDHIDQLMSIAVDVFFRKNEHQKIVSVKPNVEMEQGKIYFISFGSSTQLIVRFKDSDACNYNFYDHLHYWNSFENFHNRTAQNYCVKHGIEEIREATLAEKHALLKFEIEHNCI